MYCIVLDTEEVFVSVCTYHEVDSFEGIGRQLDFTRDVPYTYRTYGHTYRHERGRLRERERERGRETERERITLHHTHSIFYSVV